MKSVNQDKKSFILFVYSFINFISVIKLATTMVPKTV